MSATPRSAKTKAFAFAALAPAFLLMLSTQVKASVQISGGVEAVRIEANDASFEEIFAALSAHYGLKYHCPEKISRTVSGTYTGPLGQVLSRLLQGYNFAFERSASGSKLRVYDLGAGHESGIGLAVNAPAGLRPPQPRVTPPLPYQPAAPLLRGARPGIRLPRWPPPQAHRQQVGR